METGRGAALERLLAESRVQRALAHLARSEPGTIQTQVDLCEIPAPPFSEEVRAAEFRARLQRLGLRHVRIDAEGNVLGERPGGGDGPTLVVSAHLDTVFAAGTDVRVRRVGDRLLAPGIADDSRGLAVVLALVEALDAADVATAGTIVFAGTVGEEGAGDLRGVRHLVDSELAGRMDAFISIDGSGLQTVTDAVGSRRLRFAFTGPGGHSFADFGTPNPVHAAGSAIARIAALEVPESPRTTFSVGTVHGGTAVNAIPREAAFEVDLRSLSEEVLAGLERSAREAASEGVRSEVERRTGPLELRVEEIGRRPAAIQPESLPLALAAIRAANLLGACESTRASSTDANYPMSRGIPSVTLGGGGRSGGAHTLEEWFEPEESHLGPQRALLVALATVGLVGLADDG
jgi:tripeptide aminopeptidase